MYFKKAPVSKIKRIITFVRWTISHIDKIRWAQYIKVLNVLKYGKEAWTLHLFFESQWFLKTEEFDVVHAHFGPYASRIAHLKANNILSSKTKFVATFHGYDLKPNNFIISFIL